MGAFAFLVDTFMTCRPEGPISETACYFRKDLQKDNLLTPNQYDFGGPGKKKVIEFGQILEYGVRESPERHEKPVEHSDKTFWTGHRRPNPHGRTGQNRTNRAQQGRPRAAADPPRLANQCFGAHTHTHPCHPGATSPGASAPATPPLPCVETFAPIILWRILPPPLPGRSARKK